MVEQGICKTVEEGLKMINEDVEQKEHREKILPKDVFIEAQIAGISAVKMAEIINKNIEREAESDLTVEQRVKVLSEAHLAGIDVENPEERKRVLGTAKKQQGKITVEKPRPLTEGEKKGLLAGERMTAGYGNSLFEPRKNKE